MRNMFLGVMLIFWTIIALTFSKDLSIAVITVPMAFLLIFLGAKDEDKEIDDRYKFIHGEWDSEREPQLFDLSEEDEVA